MHRSSLCALMLLAALPSCGRVPAADDFPARFVARTTNGRLVLGRTSDGSIERVLQAKTTDSTQFQLTDHAGLYVAPGVLPCGPVQRVALDGGLPVRVVARADHWSVSHDDRFIAYGADGRCGQAMTVVVRDLKTGVERRWSIPRRYRNGLAEVDGVDFLQDTRYIYVMECGFDMCGPILLDAVLDRAIDGSHEPKSFDTIDSGPLPGDTNSDWFYSGFVGRGAHGTEVGVIT